MTVSPPVSDGAERVMSFMRGLTFPGGQQPVVEGRRVYLRYPGMNDYAQWAEVREQSRAFLKPWEPSWPEDDLTKSGYRRRLRRYAYDSRMDLAYAFFILRREDNALLGGVTLSNVRRGVVQTCTLGYWAGVHHARRGYTYEAVAAIVPFIFDTLGLHRIEAACLPDNTPSRGLLRKAGFREEGLALRYLQIDGKWADHVLYGLVEDEPRPGG